jgi:spermidine/putrescine transport system permease protein
LFAALLFLFLYAPLVVVVVFSFNDARHGAVWRGFTTEWYVKLLDTNPNNLNLTDGDRRLAAEKRAALRNTLIVAGASTLVATVLGTMLGYGLSRYWFPGKKLFSWLMYIPVVIPDIVMAVAMMLFYRLAFDAIGIFKLGLTTMIIAHITFQIPFVAIVVRSRLAGMDPSIEEAAHDLGANTWRTFWHVTLPMMLLGVLAGGMLAFTLSLDDFVVSNLTNGNDMTLPILIYTSVRRGITPDINALSTLMILVSVIATIGVTWMQRPRQTTGGS